MSLVNINFKPDQKELHQFGKTMIIGFSIIAIAVYFIFESQTAAIGCFIFGVVSFILSRLGKAAMIVYLPWMAFGFVMGTIVSNVILALLYFVLITPIALFFKITKRDMLNRKLDKSAPTYWNDAINRDNEGAKEYERQF